MPEAKEYKFTVDYRGWSEEEFRSQSFKTMLGAKAFFDFVSGDSDIQETFLWDNETTKIIRRSVK